MFSCFSERQKKLTSFSSYESIDFKTCFTHKLPARHSYVLLRPRDGLWGAPLSNGSYSGMMGMLLTGVSYYYHYYH